MKFQKMKIKVLFLSFFFIFSYGNAQSYFGKISFDSTARRYEKYEIGLQLDLKTSIGINRFVYQRLEEETNPFDPLQINVQAEFSSPSGKKSTRYGFYYQPFKSNQVLDKWTRDTTTFPWRIRFAPAEIGEWKVKVSYQTDKVQSDTLNLSFRCDSSEHKGYLIAEKKQRYFQFKKDSSTFLTIGNNISSGGFLTYKPSQNERHLKGVQQLIDVGGNFTRFDMQPQAALPDWPDISNYAGKLDEMYAFDKIVDLCEKNDVYFIVFRHHIELMDSKTNPGGSDWSGVSWFDNPYQKQLKLEQKIDYFTDSTALLAQRNALRYVISRWAYSPNFSFYGYSEIDNWIKDLVIEQQHTNPKFNQNDALELFKQWFNNQQSYINELAPNMLYSNSYSVLPDFEQKKIKEGIFGSSDIISLHNYGETKAINYKNRYEAIKYADRKYDKPVLMEEIGVSDSKLRIYCCSGIEYHNSIWSSVMSGSTGTGLDWWWDRGVQDFGYHLDLKPLQQYFDGYDLNNMKLTPQKWSESLVSKRKLENFTLLSEQKDTVFGWIHNATFYWRNLLKGNSCIAEIVAQDSLKYPCFVGEGHDLNQEPKGNFKDSRFNDSYTLQGGVMAIKNNSVQENPCFQVSNLKRSSFSRNQWYKVEFYHVNRGDLMKHQSASQLVSSSFFGKIKVHVPNLDHQNPDYAYKVFWIGSSKKREGLIFND